ncbi:MAG: hypothetical protein JNN06_16720 [Gemmobacter sp.]|uniref:hypothetical protein n=1 Tax=Gemmobacter sp. TaxID=1898957 RepID=UPI001A505950|nr:hypothetical protein [Gemmobacter sp.]MBL8563913.1 hypothetical protein [Gemmobacter sp.]
MATPAGAQARLGAVAEGGTLRLPLAETVPLSRLRVEIDGIAVAAGLRLAGRDLLVTLPPGLQGASHDITLYRVEPGADVELGIWAFETPSGATEVTLTGRIEAGVQAGPEGTAGLLQGSGRIGFSRDGGRWRGALGFRQDQEDDSRNPRSEITDYFLEHRGALWGDALIARIGTQEPPGETLAMDDSARRGLSLRLQDPGGRSDVMLFAVSPNAVSGRRNLTGLEDQGDLVRGVAARVLPLPGRGVQADLLAYAGRAEDGDRTARVAGQALRLSGPLALLPGGSFELGYLQSRHEIALNGFPETRQDQAFAAEIGMALLPEGDERSLTLTLGADRTGPDVILPLNPDLTADADQAGREIGLLWQSAFWQWEAKARRAETNLDGLEAERSDALHDYGFDLYFLPDDFTGGPLNGMTFFLSLGREDQRWLRGGGPDGSGASEDFRLDSLSLGMDKFQPDYAWALSLTREALRPASGADETDLALEGLYAWTPDDATTLTLAAELGQLRKPGSRYNRLSLEAGYGWDLAPGLWTGFVEAGWQEDQDPEAEEGAYFGAELARRLSPATELVMRADYGRGAEAPDLAEDGGWVMGLTLRHDLGSSR